MRHYPILVALALLGPLPSAAAQDGDPAKGEELFRACAACHSLAAERHMTGPSLAGIWERKAGTVEGFNRYSDALRNSALVWDAETLDAWLTDPAGLIPGNLMNFRGVKDADKRRDLVAYLRQAAAGRGAQAARGQELLDLKQAPPANRVVSVRYCNDTYTVTNESGEEFKFWEFNLRIKTDGSGHGPEPEHPALISGGMMGDRAFLVFASPTEISSFIAIDC